MTRYVIKKDGQWSVVNAHYKRILKTFKTQKEAIKYAQSLDSTTSITLQGDDNKFRKITNWDTSEVRKTVVRYIPRYIYKETGIKRNNMAAIILMGLIGLFITLAIVFFSLYGMEL